MYSEWSKIILDKTGAYRTRMFEAERYIWRHPQTGFKEWEAHRYLKEQFAALGFQVAEAGNIPGFTLDIDTGKKGPTVAILGELDALILPDHPDSDPKTGAVHACGHNCQSAALLGIAGALSDAEVLSKLCGRIRLVAVPAEEMIEMSDRLQMKKDGLIQYYSGKSEFMKRGIFNDVDIAVMVHSDLGRVPGLNVGKGTSGIITKRVILRGKENVSGAAPTGGINALYAANTAMAAVNALRETFPAKQDVRVHTIISQSGGNLQYMPAEVVVEMSVRAYQYAVLKEVGEKVDRAYAAAAAAFGAEAVIEDLELYMPENGDDSATLAEVAYGVGCDLFGKEHTNLYRDPFFRSPGGTDMGNLGSVIPCLQPYLCSAGIVGHCREFQVEEPEYAVRYHAAVLAAMACVLLENNGRLAEKVLSEYHPLFPSFEAYFEEMDAHYRARNAVQYLPDGARLTWK